MFFRSFMFYYEIVTDYARMEIILLRFLIFKSFFFSSKDCSLIPIWWTYNAMFLYICFENRRRKSEIFRHLLDILIKCKKEVLTGRGNIVRRPSVRLFSDNCGYGERRGFGWHLQWRRRGDSFNVFLNHLFFILISKFRLISLLTLSL